jgi:hypothetical protein
MSDLWEQGKQEQTPILEQPGDQHSLHSSTQWYSTASTSWSGTLIKRKTKLSSYIRKFRVGSGAKSYMRKGFLIYEEMRKFSQMRRQLVIYDFAPDPSYFPYI